ncbi:MAG: NADH-quinone oxidoreductase subunit NuoE [Dehalococcoidia bacterium]|nr:NADH-quinone oxidoreductase subunit NuoE [Dehalococcoidia bacterium]
MTKLSVVQDTWVPLPEQEATIEERLNEILSSYQGRDDELIPIMQQVQQQFGYLPEPVIKQIARFLHLPDITIFGVATFYAQFKLVPTGRNIIRVCRGTACHVRGVARILQELENQLGVKPGETTADREYSLETVACFGACALSPIMVLDDKVHGKMTTQKVRSILDATGSSSELKDG